MNVLFVTTEVRPFAKTGGLGDVCGALPVALRKLGVKASVVLPAFRSALECGLPIQETGIRVEAPIGRKWVSGDVLLSHLPDSDVPVYLIRNDEYFNRGGLYWENGQDYHDNCERFVFFGRAVLEATASLGLNVDVLHCHDWPTGLLPAYLKTIYADRDPYRSVASLFTIHNLAYQGDFWHWDMELTGVGWEHFNHHQMEFYGRLNFMKSALSFADALSTVSPRYAEEVLSQPMSCGMEGVLRHRRADLHGVLNGVDYGIWNPATDPHLAARYTADDFESGKRACKEALQRELGLPVRPDVPVLATVGRLAEQKGVDLTLDILPRYARQVEAQWVFLGTGDQRYHDALSALAREYPDRVAVRLEFSDPLAHRIEAGADLFLMPSRYEPCGLNQMYSLRYGTLPVVRETGGLADTIVDANERTLAAGTANGFSFADPSSHALAMAIDRGCRMWRDPATRRQLVQTGMRQDWSWDASARKYVELYAATIEKARREAVGV